MQYFRGFWYPDVNKDCCINCNLCEKVCPISNYTLPNNTLIKSYAAYNKDENIRINSSSGGLFSVFASYILKNGGVVFGAAFDKDYNVVHIAIDNESDLYRLRGSKYVQSKVGYTFKQAKEYLEQGKLVYFSGTACQIDGFMTYLGKDYGNLICQDLICHGVPSPEVWKKYLEYKNNNDIDNINFRDKSEGWYNYSLKIWNDSGFEYKSISKKDMYLLGFSHNVYLRPSCYNCRYKTVERKADITLADFWGIENEIPEMFDDKGTSFIIIHSDKGQKLLDNISESIVCKKIDIEAGAKYQSTFRKSAYKNLDYNKFFKNMDKMSFDKLYEKYFSDKFILKLKRYIARKFNK